VLIVNFHLRSWQYSAIGQHADKPRHDASNTEHHIIARVRKLVWVRKEWITTSSKKLLRLRNDVCTVCHFGLGLHRAYVFFFLLPRCIPSSKCKPSGRKLRSTFNQFSFDCVSSALNVGEPLHCCCGIAAAFSSGYRRSERRPTSNEKGSIGDRAFSRFPLAASRIQ
jgi:hypothetical protein